MTDQFRGVRFDYDYAIIRIVPRVQLGTFVNVGVVLHSRTAGFLGALVNLKQAEVAPLCPDGLDMEVLNRHLLAFPIICEGGAEIGDIGILTPSERFHWLTAPRSAVVQTSDVHPGCTSDPRKCLEELFRQVIT